MLTDTLLAMLENRGDGVRLLGWADKQDAEQVLTRSWSGTTDTPSEGGLDWVMGRHVSLGDPRRAEIVQWWMKGRCWDAMMDGMMLGVRVGEGSSAPIGGVSHIHENKEIPQ